MARLTLALFLAFTLAACGGGNGAVQDDDDAKPTATPDDQTTFADLVSGQSIVLTSDDGPPVCLRFTAPWRFESWDAERAAWYAGDYADLSEAADPGTAGALGFVWDDPDYAPHNSDAAWDLVVQLTFESETGGTFAYDYAQGDAAHPTIKGDFAIVPGRVGEDACGGETEG